MSPLRAESVSPGVYVQPPLPLTQSQALMVAAEWRRRHRVQWTALARLMGEYHGVWMSPDWWRRTCQARYGITPLPCRVALAEHMNAVKARAL